jgi:hypothetical protein
MTEWMDEARWPGPSSIIPSYWDTDSHKYRIMPRLQNRKTPAPGEIYYNVAGDPIGIVTEVSGNLVNVQVYGGDYS